MIQYRASIAVVDIFAEIVAKVEEWYNHSILYLHGVPNEVHQTLIDLGLDAPSAKRYPFIYLLQPFDEDNKGDYIQLADLHVIIATTTDHNYTSPQRTEKTFKPILYPVYDLFRCAIAANKNIVETDPDHLSVIKTDEMRWGRSGVYGSQGEIFTDKIDAIELTKLQLKLKKANCLTQI